MFVLTLLFACKTPPPAVEGTLTGCDPLDEASCLFPFPSRYHLKEADTRTGLRVHYGADVLPKTDSGVQVGPEFWNEKDGYSTNSSLLFFFADGTAEGLTRWPDAGGAPTTTVVVDLQTGRLIPHFVDLDASAENPDQRAYVIHPIVPLAYNRDYAVGVRSLVNSSGAAVQSSSAFRALRDGELTESWDVEHRRDRFDSIVFPALERAGFVRSELQLAWEFHTVSRENSLGRMVWMRDDALARVGASGPAYQILSVEEGDCSAGENIGRTVELEVTSPLYTEHDAPGTLLTRDGDGQPFYNGDTHFGVTVKIPCSVLASGQPAPVIQYGHGLLGERLEIGYGWSSAFLNSEGFIGVAADWTGFAVDDIPSILSMSRFDPGRFAQVPERSTQGLVQQLLIAPLLRGPLVHEGAFQQNGTGLIGPTLGYYGNSQGGILGASFMALSQDIHRGVLGVTGVNYGITLTRSRDFELYFSLYKDGFSDSRDIALMIQGLTQQLWDVSDGAGYLHAMTENPLPNTPPKQILLHAAIGDAQVTTIGAEIQARAYGAKTIHPAYRPVYGVEEVDGGFTGSALVEWHYSDASAEPIDNIPPEEGGDPHECPRREEAAQHQIYDFLTTGVVVQHCDGVCSARIEDVCP